MGVIHPHPPKKNLVVKGLKMELICKRLAVQRSFFKNKLLLNNFNLT